jgi:Ras family protein T1
MLLVRVELLLTYHFAFLRQQVESCVECSAKTLFNIDEIFYFAQKSVLYPGNVLYDPATEKFKPLAITAMKRVFRLCDKDADGFWNDYELNFMQVRQNRRKNKKVESFSNVTFVE